MGQNLPMTPAAWKSLEALHPDAKKWIMHHFGNALTPLIHLAQAKKPPQDKKLYSEAADHMVGDYEELVDAMQGRRAKRGR